MGRVSARHWVSVLLFVEKSWRSQSRIKITATRMTLDNRTHRSTDYANHHHWLGRCHCCTHDSGVPGAMIAPPAEELDMASWRPSDEEGYRGGDNQLVAPCAHDFQLALEAHAFDLLQ
jgi:hypothetical protein